MQKSVRICYIEYLSFNRFYQKYQFLLLNKNRNRRIKLAESQSNVTQYQQQKQ